MTLYFKGSNGNMREIAQISDSLSTEEARAEALQHIKKFCDDRHFHIYYVRMWNTKVKGKKMTAFDVGSHTEFFYTDTIVFNSEAVEEPTRFQLAISVSMLVVYLVVAYVRL